jgi:hypothetical protein
MIFFCVKSWFFTRNTPKFSSLPPLGAIFLSAPPNLKSWICPCIRQDTLGYNELIIYIIWYGIPLFKRCILSDHHIQWISHSDWMNLENEYESEDSSLFHFCCACTVGVFVSIHVSKISQVYPTISYFFYKIMDKAFLTSLSINTRENGWSNQ